MPPKITPEGQEAKNRIALNKQLRQSGVSAKNARQAVRSENPLQAASIALANAPKIEGVVSAEEIANPPSPVTPPVPQTNTNDGSRLNASISGVANANAEIIGRDLESRQRADEINALLGTQQTDGASQFESLSKETGLNDLISRREDIQLQLAQRNTQSELTKTRIAGAAGQTLAQAGREVTQEDREAAVRDAGLAAEAAVLNGSIETASAIVSQAMDFYYKDAQIKNQNMIQQLNYFSSIADGETKQLLEKDKRAYEADQKKIERTLDAVDAAVTSGAATPAEIRLLTDPNTSDEDRTSLAQAITGRAAKSLYDATLYGKYLSNAVAQKELDALNAPIDPNAVPAETLKAVEGLSDGQRTAITASRETINEIDRMIALVESVGDMSLLTKATEEGREFLRLRKNVVDKLARQRTGAVVGVDEEKTFKDILGVGVFDLVAKDDAEVVTGLRKFRAPHEEALSLNDPTGEIRNFLDATKVDDEDEVNAIWGVQTGTPAVDVSSYFK